ncbi:MAG: hypothetical protein ACN0LA_07190 [Candidatus Longimicrobiales bacterium M2_2A_002]
MEDIALWPWLTLLGLGALHGVNPGMGWLFAVALGLQEGRARAVWRALPPLALGHGLAIALAVLVAAAVGQLIPVAPLKWGVAAILLAFGLYRLRRHAHPRYGGLRVGARQLTIWSFLMATAHGAGLMILPVVLAGDAPMLGPAAGMEHTVHAAGLPTGLASGVAVTLVHTVGYLVVAMALAWLVYARLGVRILRSAWVNIDLLWAVALIATALVTPLL